MPARGKNPKPRSWLFKHRTSSQVRWAFRFFIVSYLLFFVLSLVFYFTYIMRVGYLGSLIYTLFGPVSINIAVYLLLFTFGVWMVGWAILWGKRQSPRPRWFTLGSWAIPLSIAYVWVSLSVTLVLGVGCVAMNVISLGPPLLVAVLVPQLFVWEVLNRRERLFGKVCVGLGLASGVLWFAGTFANDAVLPVVEVLLPAYLGVLIIEYFSVHLRVNGPGF